MKNAMRGLIAAASVCVMAGAAQAQTSYDYQYQPQAGQGEVQYTTPGANTYTGPTTYAAPGSTYAAPGTTYTAPGSTFTAPGTTYTNPGYTVPGTNYGQPSTVYPQPQPYYPPTSPQVIYPGVDPSPYNPAPARPKGYVEDTDAWTFNLPRYYPAIRACLRNAGSVTNPVIANIQERENATVMLIGQGGTSEYSVCRTGLSGTRVRPGKEERGLPPAFYAPVGSRFTVTPDRPFQPVVDTEQRLLGWVVRTTPVRLDLYGGRGFDGQFIKPVTVNPDAR